MRPTILLTPLLAVLLAACGGSTVPVAADASADAAPADGATGPSDAALDPDAAKAADGLNRASDGRRCEGDADIASLAVLPGGTITRPSGSALRLDVAYRGVAVALTFVRGVDMTLSPSDGPFSTSKNAGYWAELDDAAGKPLYTRLVQDPTVVEAPGADGGFTNRKLDECEPKTFHVDLENDPRGAAVVIYGVGYAKGGFAHELGRFAIK